ncbi:MAG: ABC transporter permease [Thermodesulfobacteriota bacterium]
MNVPHPLRFLARAGGFALRAGTGHPFRSGVALLAVALGVAALTVLAAVREGALRKASEIFAWYGADAVFVVGSNVASAAPGKRTRTITADDVREMSRALPGVEAAAPVRVKTGLTLRAGRRSSAGHMAYGATEGYARIWNWPLEQGRDFTAEDLDQGAKVVLLGAGAARKIFGGAPPLGRQVLLGDLPLAVVGVLAERGLADGHGSAVDDRVILPLSTLTRRFNLERDTFMSVRVVFAPGSDLETGMAGLRSLLRARHRIGPGMDDDFSVIGPQEILAFRTTLEQGMMAFLAVAAALALAAGGAVLANVFSLNLAERRGEIGLRRAVGATRGAVSVQLAAEAVLLTLAGGIMGLGLGWLASLLLEWRGVGPVGFAWSVFGLGVAASLAVGLAAGLRPALAAARQDPAQALRGA